MKQLKHITIAFVLFFLADIAMGQGVIFICTEELWKYMEYTSLIR